MGTLFFVVLITLQLQRVFCGCLSKEQFLASLDRTQTSIFEAELVKLETAQNAYVRVKRVYQQSPYSWQLSPGNAAHIRGIRPRAVDPASCLPELRVGQKYVWVTQTNISMNPKREASLVFYPGGLFATIDTGKKLNDGKRPVVRPSPDIPQHDAAYSPMVHPKVTPVQTGSGCDLQPCPTTLQPVCGTDGVLYQNPCLLQQRACEQRLKKARPVSIDRLERCQREYTKGKHIQSPVLCPSGNLCNYGARCPPNSSAVQAFFPSCDCRHIRCSLEPPGAVCASDGETYANECYLRKAMCVMQQMKRIQYYGPCTSNPCFGHSCRWPGERCEVDDTGQPRCVCPEECPAVVMHVCGSDGMTYDSHCHLERTACLKMRDLRVVYAGQCSQEPQCQNLGLYCQGYEICSRVPARQIYNQGSHSTVISGSQEATIASCTCPQCPEKGLGDKVCGTDGRTYRSECHLRAHACEYQLYEVKVRSRGPCDACSNKQCNFYAICQRNMDGEPQCICPTDCPYTEASKKVCGSDGNTYENECHLKVRSCAEQRQLTVASEGPCKSCPHGCPLGYQCQNGECVYRETCPASNDVEPEVCGTNGEWFRSECELKRQACVRSTSIDIDPSGVSCRGSETITKPERSIPQADQFAHHSCTCDKLGALSEYCDQHGKCHCKPGTGGEKCEHCVQGYWGLQNGHQCIPCSCHQYGSFGTSCDQLTGQCTCRPGLLGRQCSICPNNGYLGPSGCQQVEEKDDLQIEPPPDPDLFADDEEGPDTEVHEQKLAGRLFSPQTTLLVRAPANLEQPVTVELLFTPTSDDGIILQYRTAPSEREQLLVHNLQDNQFSLMLIGGRVECTYLNGRSPNRLLVVQSPSRLRLHMQHKLRAGVADSRPWVQIDAGYPTTVANVGTRWVTQTGDDTLHFGGYGTIVVGRPILSMVHSTTSDTGASLTQGFTGCLLKFNIHTGEHETVHEVDLISGDRTYLAWIGVDRLPSGLYEAPICTAIVKPIPEDPLNAFQSDARRTSDVCERDMPCQNAGLCHARAGDLFECVCQPGWQGTFCEQTVTIIPKFGGNSYIRLPGPNGKQSIRRKRLTIELTVLVTKSPGLIFFIPPAGPDHTGSFISVYIDKQNYIVVLCRVGTPSYGNTAFGQQSRIVQLPYRFPIQLNTWHTIRIDKLPRMMRVQIDKQPVQKILILSNQYNRMAHRLRRQLSRFDLSKSPIYLGGYPFEQDPIDFLDIQTGLTGAIQKVLINGAEAVLAGLPSHSLPADMGSPLSPTELWQNTSQWQGTPCGPVYSPCNPDSPEGICLPQGDKATCACATPLQMLKMMTELPGTPLDRVEKMACERRQLELQIKRDKAKVVSKKSNDMQYDDQSRDLPSVRRKCGEQSVRFRGNTFLRFENLVQSTIEYNIRFYLQTTSQHGILLMMLDHPVPEKFSIHPRKANSIRELTMIVMRNGRIEFSIHTVNTNSHWKADAAHVDRTMATMLQLKSRAIVNDGDCHHIHAVRSHQKATLLVDNIMTPGEFIPHTSESSSENVVFMGGAPLNITGFPWEYQQNITGCIADMFVNEAHAKMLHSSPGSPHIESCE